MPRPYDVSAARANLNDYLKEISDLLTTQEDIEHYAAFNNALSVINDLTEAAYQPQEDGSLLPLDQEMQQVLQNAYQKALDEAAQLAVQAETGQAGERMRGIVREITPMLQSDVSALNMVDLSREPMALPEIISKAREQAVDLGDQQPPTVSGSINTRQHFQVVNDGVSEPGFFTPTVTVDPDGAYRRHLDQMEAKYPDYKPLIDQLRKMPLRDASSVNWVPNYQMIVNAEASLEEQKAAVRENWVDQAFDPLLIDAGDLPQRPDFLAVMDDIGQGIDAARRQMITFKDGDFVFPDGANLDRRNVAMSRTAALIGKRELVAEARPMMVIQNGKAVSGTFMAEAYGFNLSNIDANEPVAGFGNQNFDNADPVVMDDLAAAQALDFITGNVDRNPYNFFLRFNPKDGPNARLTGVTLIDNDMSFPEQSLDQLPPDRPLRPEDMGVIGEEFYNSLKSLNTFEQFQAAYADCGLTQQQIQRAWERKEYLVQKVEADKEYFAGRSVGETEAGHIRLVPRTQWGAYHMSDLAAKHNRSMFKTVVDMPETVQYALNTLDARKEMIRRREENRRRVLDLPPQPQAAPQGDLPAATVVGNGLQQNQAPMMEVPQDSLKLAIPALSNIKPVGGQMNKRYPVTWMENGEPKKGFFSPADSLSIKQGMDQIFADYTRRYPRYADEIRVMHNYYNADTIDDVSDIPEHLTEAELQEMGFSEDKAEELMDDRAFKSMQENLKSDVITYASKVQTNLIYGINANEQNRIDLRNVTTTDVSDILGVPDLTARSRTVQVEAGGKLMDGIIMEEADGLDIDRVMPGDPVATIPEDKIPSTFNTKEGIASVADLQILDYVCLNVDRNPNNMFYRFDGLGTDDPKFLGVQAIDNDFSFGTLVPAPNENTKALPSLNNLQIITEDMAKRVNDPKSAEALEQKMRKSGRSDDEITAAKTRLNNIKEAVNNGRIRVVKKDDLGKEPYTFEQLSQEPNYFLSVQENFIGKMKNMSRDYHALPENQRPQPEPKETLKFGQSVKVDELGSGLKDNKEFEKLSKEAEKQFLDSIAETAKQAPAPVVKSEKDMMLALVRESKEMHDQLDAADPWNHRTSAKYKNIKNACKDLGRLAKKMAKKLRGPNDTLSLKDRHKIVTQLNKIRDCSAEYDAKKEAERQRGQEPSTVGKARLQKSLFVRDRSKVMRRTYHKTLAQSMSKESALSYAHDMVKANQLKAAEQTGDELKNSLAEMLYYKALTKMDYGSKRGKALKNAVDPDIAQTNRDLIMNTRAFKRMCEMPEKELKELATKKDGDGLLNTFVSETVKEMRSEKVKENRQQELDKVKQKNEQVKEGPQGPVA